MFESRNCGTSLNNFSEASIKITVYFFTVLIFWYFSIKGKVRRKKIKRFYVLLL
jgi:hypothetical protein